MGKLGKLVKHIINSFLWRKHIIEYTGKDPLQCKKCGGPMKVFEIYCRNKNGEMKKYGGVNLLLKKLELRDIYEPEKKAETKEKEKITTKKSRNGVNYVCSNCGTEEKIPAEVLEELENLF